MCCCANASSGQCFPKHLYGMCQLFESLSLSKHKKTPPHFITALPFLRQQLQKQLAWYTGIPKSDLSCHSDYMVYSTVLIGCRCFIFADWSNSKFCSGWLVKIKVMLLLICLISEFWSAAQTKPLDGADYPTSWVRQIGSIKSVISWISCFKQNKRPQSLQHSTALFLSFS